MKHGKVVWNFPTGAEVKCSPCLLPGSCKVLIGSHDGHMYALNAKERVCAWKTYCRGGAIFSSPCVYYDTKQSRYVAYAGTLGGSLVCISCESGEILWGAALGKPVFSSPCSCDYGACVGCVDNNVYMLDHRSGAKLWSFSTEKPVFSSPSLSCSGKSIVVGSHDGCLYNIDASDGSMRWRTDRFDTALYSTPCVFHIASLNKELVIFAVANGTLCIADMDNGRIIHSVKLPGEVFSSPKILTVGIKVSDDSDDLGVKIIVGCRDDFVYCFSVSADRT